MPEMIATENAIISPMANLNIYRAFGLNLPLNRLFIKDPSHFPFNSRCIIIMGIMAIPKPTCRDGLIFAAGPIRIISTAKQINTGFLFMYFSKGYNSKLAVNKRLNFGKFSPVSFSPAAE